ncbi:hypothetical protein [Candidatus Odyssella acanthamoebae]|nr:hypothetical protein [Candidatus Paracaedibacter acanthamoebae]
MKILTVFLVLSIINPVHGGDDRTLQFSFDLEDEFMPHKINSDILSNLGVSFSQPEESNSLGGDEVYLNNLLSSINKKFIYDVPKN